MYSADYLETLLWFFAGFFVFVELPILLAAFSMAPWLPTRKSDLPRVNELLKLKKGEVFYDLGCGDGRICHYVAERNPEADVCGFELAYPLFLWARLMQLFRPKKNLRIKLKNVFKQDLSGADVIYFFGLRKTLNKRLKKKFERELKKGTRVFVYDDEIEGWEKLGVNRPTHDDVPIYIYAKS